MGKKTSRLSLFVGSSGYARVCLSCWKGWMITWIFKWCSDVGWFSRKWASTRSSWSFVSLRVEDEIGGP